MSGNHPKPSSSAGAAGSHATAPVHIPSIEEKNKKIQQETLMEKLRAKYRNKPKSYDDIKKSVRMYFIEKHYPLDPVCKATLRTALDKLQHYIKVSSRHGLVERLESLSRQLGLKFMEDQQTLFISTDMFYVEILLDAAGKLSDVKVHHECKSEQQSNSSSSCSELLNCLKQGDFADFTVQLEGLSSIYQLNAEPKVKKKAFVALEAMETDIYNLYQQQLQVQQQNTSSSYQIMNKSSVGLVLQRRGGHSMKLTYFCPPLHLVEAQIRGDSAAGAESRDFTIDQVMKSPVGLNVTLNLEGSSANKLQILPIVSFTNESGLPLELPAYAPLTQVNSMLMPATYVLRLSKPMPVCIESLRALGLPGLGNVPNGQTTSVMNLIVQTASRQVIRTIQKGLYVNLPKETHCYFLTDHRRLQGTMLSSLQFTEPAQVPKIIAFLKKQALFYTLLSSCVREQQKQYNDMESTIILEVTAVSLNQITVELQHPYEESLATVDFLLEDGEATCTIYCLSNEYDALSQKLTRTVRQVVSIPMVIYKLLKCWDEEHLQKLHGAASGAGSGTGSGTAGGYSSSSSGAGGGSGGMQGSSNFGQFAMDTGSVSGEGASGVGGGFSSVSNIKMDNNLRSLAAAFADSTSAAAAIAGIISLKRETDPQPQSSASSSSIPTPGSSSSASASTSAAASKSSEHEIADKYKNIWKDKTPNLKHCVSITPIAGDGKSPLQQQQQQVDVQRTGGIEIIPLNAPSSVGATPSAGSPATTITITPITGTSGGGGGKDSSKEPKKSASSAGASGTKRPHDSSSSSSSSSNSSNSSTSSSSSDTQKEKKRKKKRDDSPMGPPEKIYSRQNSPAAGGLTDASAGSGVVRKFSSPSASSSSSPKVGVAGVGAALGLMAGQPSARPSPKHSPVYSSPKHSSNTASNSPKSPFGTHSPKHGSSGKPSMSTLKSATAATTLSLSPKAEKPSSGSGAVGSSGVSVPLTLPLPTSASGSGSSGNAPMMRPVPPLAASSSQLPAAIKKDKSLGGSSSAGGPSGVVGAAVAALKGSQQQQQPVKPSVASLSHLAAGGNLGSYAAPAVAGLDLNALRKGMAGTGVGPGMGVAAGAVGAVSLMTSTAASTATIPTTATASTSTTATAAAAAAAATTTVDSSATTTATAAVGTGVPPPLAPATSTSSTAASASATMATHQQLATAQLSSDSGIITGAGPGTGLSTEYMVKPSSQEGLKLTINKTGSSSSSSVPGSSSKREGKSGPSGSSTGSKKQHTGLKPGVNSGPASKKAQSLGLGSSAGGSSSNKNLFQKANSSGNLSSKLGGSSSTGGGVPLTKSNSTNSFQEHNAPRRRPSLTSGSGGGGASGSGSGGQRKTPSAGPASGSATGTGMAVRGVSPAASSGSMSQPPPRFDHHTDMMTILQYASPSMTANMEGFIKGLHNKFQIPKLSQRTGSSNSGAGTTSSTDQTTVSATTSSSTSSSSQGQQPSGDINALAAVSSGQQTNPMTTDPPSTGNDIDEELLARLAGE